ncbi:MAG: transposase [candidate division Zixibacteria bacterium]|nr:transposase [candidate division Zixibacteria bacterium]
MNDIRNNRQYDSRPPQRRSRRLPEYDYGLNGAYFVTICTRDIQMLFDDSRIKRIVEDEWLATTKRRGNVIIDEYVVMPNHLHGIIVFTNPWPHPGAYVGDRTVRMRSGTTQPPGVCDTPLQHRSEKRALKSTSQTLGAIIRGFKAASTGKIRRILGKSGLCVWQRNYYEHIIRNDQDLHDIRKYINDNPLKWELDKYAPTGNL